jgi:uncharacterized protein YmfQ (DUF2313 family)
MEKITYITALNYALDNLTNAPDEIKEKLTALRDQTAKRNSADRKPTKTQAQNLELSEVVAEVLAASSDPLTITEIMQRDDRLAGLSNQKVTAVVRSMGARIEKVADKRVNRFKLA